jgi:hypothetical protein
MDETSFGRTLALAAVVMAGGLLLMEILLLDVLESNMAAG